MTMPSDFYSKRDDKIKPKGVKIKYFLVFGIIFIMIVGVNYSQSQPHITENIPHETEPKKVLPTGDDMASKCERAKQWNLEWYHNNCN